MAHNVIDELRAVLPPVFAGPSLDDLTGGAIVWRTIQNKRSLRQIPIEVFAYTGRRVLVRRDPFLNWWAGTLSDGTTRRGPGRPRKAV